MKKEEMANWVLDYLGINHAVVDGSHPVTWGWCERCMKVGTLTKMLTEYTAPLELAVTNFLADVELFDHNDECIACGSDRDAEYHFPACTFRKAVDILESDASQDSTLKEPNSKTAQQDSANEGAK